MKTIAIINQKGGVGKSTTAQAIGTGLFLRGYKVLFVDLDAQGNLSYNFDALNRPISTMEVLQKTATIEEATLHTAQGDIVPSSLTLSIADTTLTEIGKEYRLREALEPVSDKYDYVILDTPPALSILTVNALVSCNEVIIPSQADVYSLQGIGQLNQTIDTVRKYCNHDLIIKGILLTRYNKRSILTREVTEMLENTAKMLNTKVFDTKIRECISIKEAQLVKQNIFEYAPNSNASIDYKALIIELMAQGIPDNIVKK